MRRVAAGELPRPVAMMHESLSSVRVGGILAVVLLSIAIAVAEAHPAPFSYLDVRLDTFPDRAATRVQGQVVLHVYDLAHDLHVDPARLADTSFLATARAQIVELLDSRSALLFDRQLLVRRWTALEPLRERQSVAVRFTGEVARSPAVVTLRARLFPYDPTHQTFINIYDGAALRLQGILDAGHSEQEYFTGTAQGRVAVVARFGRAGIHHILNGPDHLLFLFGLLLLGGSFGRLARIVTAFTAAHSVTLSVAAMGLVSLPARIVEPAIALSIIYIGADNLLIGRGRDVRGWIAFTFGLVHGFGFAGVLHDMHLPQGAVGWSLLSFNAGVEIGQLFVVLLVATAVRALRGRSDRVAQRLAFAGSLVVVVAGTFWFVQRVFLGGGVS